MKVNCNVNRLEPGCFSREIQSHCTKHHAKDNILDLSLFVLYFAHNINKVTTDHPTSASIDFSSYCFTTLARVAVYNLSLLYWTRPLDLSAKENNSLQGKGGLKIVG